jgi:serine protease Do
MQPKLSPRRTRLRKLTLAMVAAGVIGGTGLTGGWHLPAQAAPAAPAAIASDVARPATGQWPDFAAITREQGPAVVNISVVGRRAPATARDLGVPDDDPLWDFFRRFGGPGFGMPPGAQAPAHGQGSGFIVSADGIVLTNAHVVKDAQEVTVKLTDRREFKAEVVGVDERTDVAVLRIDAKGLPAVQLGSTRSLAPGQWVLAIGSPFGFENSVTAGVVSATGRSLPGDSEVPFVQTDVAVNPGNSGGPLFNARGEVVGINSQIYSRTGGYQGVSFAIPIEVAIRVKDQIIEHGKASHARLGIAIQGVNQALADSFRLEKPEGALVSSVEPGSPADRAGLQSGDVILAIDGVDIVSAGDLPAKLGMMSPGERVKLAVWRNGKQVALDARLGDAAEGEAVAAASEQASQGRLGLAVRPLQPGELARAGVESGLLVQGADGPAAAAGIQPGDVLLAVNGKPVASVEDVRTALAASSRAAALLIQRGDERVFVPVPMA